MNYWLVSRGLKHGIMTVRNAAAAPMAMPAHDAPKASRVTRAEITSVTLLSIVLLAAGIALSLYIADAYIVSRAMNINE
jgi:hypothetical protein